MAGRSDADPPETARESARPRGGFIAAARGWRIGSILLRLTITAAIWLVLTAGSTHSPLLAAIVICVAVIGGLLAIPPGAVRLSALGVMRFLPLYVDYSVRGGIEVARLAFRRPDAPLAGTFVFVTSLPEPIPRYFFVAVIGLMPGSIAVRVEDRWITIHALDRRDVVEERLRVLERRVGAMFRA